MAVAGAATTVAQPEVHVRPLLRTSDDAPEAHVARAPSRLLVVANRLPISVSKSDAGVYSFKMSSGGLVSALVSVRNDVDFVWMGWLGKEIPPADQPLITRRLAEEYSCVPIFLTDTLAELYYNGFANDVLWPLLHYEHLMGGTKPFNFKLFEAYQAANEAFADAVAAVAQPGDCIWLHDYHLMCMPSMLRSRLKQRATIAWFLHTPWPSSEIYRALPVRDALLKSLLACDMLGFHTYDYARHFITSVANILPEAMVSPTHIHWQGRDVRVGVYPIGIEPEAFTSIVRTPGCQQRVAELCAQFAGKRVIVAVDRLDPIKGIPHRLMALDHFLHTYPEWVGRCVFIQVAVPSRVDVDTYRTLTGQVNTLVAHINATHGDLSYQPVHYFYRSIDPVELCALYTIADCALITSLRDGMNLVCEEYVACAGEPCALREAPGALIVSEFAGCAQSLVGALRVNPWNIAAVADTLALALAQGVPERTRAHASMKEYIYKHTSRAWAHEFVRHMHDTAAFLARALPCTDAAKLKHASTLASHRCVVISLSALGGEAAALPCIQVMCAADPSMTCIAVCTDATLATLTDTFAAVPQLYIVAETDDGLYVRMPTGGDSEEGGTRLPPRRVESVSPAADVAGRTTPQHEAARAYTYAAGAATRRVRSRALANVFPRIFAAVSPHAAAARMHSRRSLLAPAMESTACAWYSVGEDGALTPQGSSPPSLPWKPFAAALMKRACEDNTHAEVVETHTGVVLTARGHTHARFAGHIASQLAALTHGCNVTVQLRTHGRMHTSVRVHARTVSLARAVHLVMDASGWSAKASTGFACTVVDRDDTCGLAYLLPHDEEGMTSAMMRVGRDVPDEARMRSALMSAAEAARRV